MYSWLKIVAVSILIGSSIFLVDLNPKAKYLEFAFDGYVKEQHPRIVLPELSQWKGSHIAPIVTSRLKAFSKQNISLQSHCLSENMLFLVSCWLSTNDNDVAKKLIKSMLNFRLITPKTVSEYSNGWQLALAYDLFFPYVSEKKADRLRIEENIERALKATLIILDDNSAALWHGRPSHAAIAWLCALVLPNHYPNIKQLRTRAQGHFKESIEALAYTEVWPEGYNYWIQNRGFLLALASSAYINGLDDAKFKLKIRELMKTVGYWHIYATRPDNRIEGFGDEGSRVDLKDETRRVIDLIVGMTSDPVLAGYSKYLQKLHGFSSYNIIYHWGLLLFNDPTIKSTGDGTLSSLAPGLTKARLFGKNAVNYAYFRSGWGRDDTFVSFKAGHTFAHHGHYDAGHFTLFKGNPMVINSSVYGGFFSENRLNYSIRTVAKNSLLILKPDEHVNLDRFFESNVSDGGQRVTQATGSQINSLNYWFQNLHNGAHYEGGKLIEFSVNSDDYHYIKADLTSAYNNTKYDDNGGRGKVEKIIRDLLYLPKEDQLIIYDQIKTTNPLYTKKWLLHTVNRPQIKDLKVLVGQLENGISESEDSLAKIQNGKGFLKVTKILPAESIMRIVGGKDFQYYVESDGDDSQLNGENFIQGAANQPWFDSGMWRLEVQPKKPEYKDEFLMILSPTLKSISNARINKIDMNSEGAIGLKIDETLIIFVNQPKIENIQFKLSDTVNKILVVGLIEIAKIEIKANSKVFNHFPEDAIFQINSENNLAGNIHIKVIK